MLTDQKTVSQAPGATTPCAPSGSPAGEAVTPAAPCVFRRILVAVDHAEHPAISAAVYLAQSLKAELCIVNVMEPFTIGIEDEFCYVQAREAQRRSASELLCRVRAGLPAQARPQIDLREGHAADAILAAAQEWGADLIIMGTHRRNAVARALLGSASQGVLRHAHCPLLLVDDHVAENG